MCKEKGFTMVELIITLVIIGILTIVSVPIYKKYVRKVYSEEGRALLAELSAAQQIYYSKYGRFYNMPVFTSRSDVLGINAATNKYFTRYATLELSDGYEITVMGSGAASSIDLRLRYSLTSSPTIHENYKDGYGWRLSS